VTKGTKENFPALLSSTLSRLLRRPSSGASWLHYFLPPLPCALRCTPAGKGKAPPLSTTLLSVG